MSLDDTSARSAEDISCPRGLGPTVASGIWSYAGGYGLMLDGEERCELDELPKLLTYDPNVLVMRKDGTAQLRRQPPKLRDQSVKFYQAQLVHDGLEKKENKEAAKKALLEAYEAKGGVWKIPLHIETTQRKLRARWEVAYAEEKKQQEERRREREAVEKAEREVQEKRWAERARLVAARKEWDEERKKVMELKCRERAELKRTLVKRRRPDSGADYEETERLSKRMRLLDREIIELTVRFLAVVSRKVRCESYADIIDRSHHMILLD
jgi:hypothetical protein